MTNMQPQQRYEIGMVGLGVIGRNLLLNMADHGFSLAGYDKDPSQVEALRKESADRDICGVENIDDFIGLLRPPRAVMMHVAIPTIDLAVAMRDLSAFENQRERIGALLQRPMQRFGGDRDEFLIRLRRALHVGLILTYVQGLSLLVGNGHAR